MDYVLNMDYRDFKIRNRMKNWIEKLEWLSDYYLVYFLYNPNKIDRYNQYMKDKWFNGEEHSK